MQCMALNLHVYRSKPVLPDTHNNTILVFKYQLLKQFEIFNRNETLPAKM